MIEIDNFTIEDSGDVKSEFPGTSWDIDGSFFFEDKDELKQFKEDLKKLFEPHAVGQIKIYEWR